MPLSPVPIGIMFSSTSPYEVVARSMLGGARLAVAEVNAAADLPVTFHPIEINPAGVPDAYCAGADTLLRSGVRHVVGCYTSSSRKEVIPYFEKHDGLLWYPSHYEGFETSGNVIYTGAVTNQHLIPLVDHLLRHHGSRLLRRIELHLGVGEQSCAAGKPAPARWLRAGRTLLHGG